MSPGLAEEHREAIKAGRYSKVLGRIDLSSEEDGMGQFADGRPKGCKTEGLHRELTCEHPVSCLA